MCRDRRRAAPPALLPAAPIRPALELPTPLGRRPPPTATDGVPIDRGDERALPDSPAPHSPPAVLVLVRWADPPPRRADLLAFFPSAIQQLVIRQRQMGPIGYVQLVLGADPPLLERVELGEQLLGIEHHTVSDDTDGALQDAGGYLVQHERLALPRVHRVPGVGAALIAHDEIRALRQHVDDLALAFIAPLSADYDDALRLRSEHSRFSSVATKKAPAGACPIL